MDFTTIWEKFNKEEYTTWNDLKEDVTLMFTNAMTYNTPDTVYHKQVVLFLLRTCRVLGRVLVGLVVYLPAFLVFLAVPIFQVKHLPG